MITEEKEEHKIEELSRGTQQPTPLPAEERTVPPACPTGQPAGTERTAEEQEGQSGWSYQDIRTIEAKRFVSPVSNTGATPPPPTTTKIDTISLTAKATPNTLIELLVESLSDQYRKEQITWAGKTKGVNGYKSGVSLLVNKREVASIYHGCDFNERQAEKPQIYIGGNGSTDHFDFHKMRFYLDQVEDPTLRRTDIAKDWYFGEVSLSDIMEAYKGGKFKNKNAPRNPKWTPIGAENPIDGTHYGITYQIGSRDSSYFFRAYLKGYERMKSLLDCDHETIVHRIMNSSGMIAFDDINDGQAFDIRKWLRGELEIKASNNRKLDLDMLIKPDEYYAGSYPYLSELVQIGDGMKPKYMKKEDELELAVRIQNMKAISGSLIEDLLFLGWTTEQIVQELRSGKGASQKLIRSGLAQKRVNEQD